MDSYKAFIRALTFLGLIKHVEISNNTNILETTVNSILYIFGFRRLNKLLENILWTNICHQLNYIKNVNSRIRVFNRICQCPSVVTAIEAYNFGVLARERNYDIDGFEETPEDMYANEYLEYLDNQSSVFDECIDDQILSLSRQQMNHAGSMIEELKGHDGLCHIDFTDGFENGVPAFMMLNLSDSHSNPLNMSQHATEDPSSDPMTIPREERAHAIFRKETEKHFRQEKKERKEQRKQNGPKRRVRKTGRTHNHVRSQRDCYA